MAEEELTEEQRKDLTDMGVNPDEFAAYGQNQLEWDIQEEVNFETAAVVLAKSAKKSLGDLKTTAPSFFQSFDKRLYSRAAVAVNKLAHTGCEAMCQLALNGNAANAGQLARLAVMLTEALADTVEKGKTDPNFKEAKKAIQEVAHWLPYWPVLFYSRSDTEFENMLGQFKELELGEGCPIKLIKERRGPSLSTPLNKQIWIAMADMYKFRHRAKDFEERKAMAELLADRSPNHSTVEFLQGMTKAPNALLSFVLGRPPTECETPILERMLELDDISPENVDPWADDVVFPWLMLSLSDSEKEEHFHPIGKVYSTGEATAKAKKSVRDKLRTLVGNS